MTSPTTTEPTPAAASNTDSALTWVPSSTDYESFTKMDDKSAHIFLTCGCNKNASIVSYISVQFHFEDRVVVLHALTHKLHKIKKPTVVVREVARAI